MSARKPKARLTASGSGRRIAAQPALKGDPPVDAAERTLLRALQRAADLEFALRETQAALRKVIHHVTTDAPNDAFRLGMCHAAAEEGLLRADNALGTQPQQRRAGDRPTFSVGECTVTINADRVAAVMDGAVHRMARDANRKLGHA